MIVGSFPSDEIERAQNRQRLRSVSRRWVALMALAIATGAHTHIAYGGAEGTAESGNRLRVRVVGLRNNKGDVCCSLFSSAEDFPTNRDLLATTVTAPILDGTAICEFAAIAPGTYAVALFHDENSDGKFNRDWLGMPKEGFGFSNDAPARWHAPSFNTASFRFIGGISEILVHIRY
jgi:uncharacterized protein (DUF2141 family)